MCESVCSLFLMHGHTFKQICTKFGTWHPYTLHMAIEGGVSVHRSSPRARIGRHNGLSALAQSGNSEPAASKHNGSSATGARINCHMCEV